MSTDDRMIPPPPGSHPAPVGYPAAPYMAPAEDPYMAPYGMEEPGLDVRRYLLAALRYKWLLALGLLVGSLGAYGAWRIAPVDYTAEGSLWVEVGVTPGQNDVTPIRAAGLLQANAWIELLKSFTVLDSVVIEEGLYVTPPSEYAPAFTSFRLAEEFLPGDYELRVGAGGDDFVLVTDQGQLVQRANFGVPIGENVGFLWQPAPGSFPPGEVVRFSVLSPREAARELQADLNARIDQSGNFLRVSLSGQSPARLARTVNAVMERHVAVAADLKRSKLDLQLLTLQEQLQVMEQELTDAEQDLEEFRIYNISLPSDRAMAIQGGIQELRDPVIEEYFQNRIELESLRRDRTRLTNALASFQGRGVEIGALEVIPSAASSTELRRLLDDLVDARSERRAYQNKYADDYPPVQELLVRIESLETRAIPQVVQELIDDLQAREREMQSFVDQGASELSEIPPRTIEEGRLRRRVEITEELHNEIRGRVETARLAAASSIPDVRVLDEATAPQTPTEDRRIPFAAAILFGCVGLAVGGALLLDRVDARFRYAADVGRAVGLDILGSIPRIEAGRGQRGALNAAQALEAFRELRIHVGFAFGAAGPITMTVTSPSAGEGKSLIASNLAVAFAEVGRRTLLIDADTRRGDAHRLLGRDRKPGLIDYLMERTQADIIQATDHQNLDFIGSGSRGLSTPELLAGQRMAYFLGTLKRSYDVIIVDSPPLAAGGDALILGSLTGNIGLVIRTGSTDKGLTQAKLDQLSRLPMRVLGAILNDVDPRDSYHSYYTAYLPGYMPMSEEDAEEAEGAGRMSGSGVPGD